MRRDVASLVLRVAAYAVPLIAVMPFGIAWLCEHRGWIPFGVATATTAGILLLASRGLALSRRHAPTPPPVGTWPDVGLQAWDDVNRLAARVEVTPPDVGDADAYRDLLLEVFDVVGGHFHPAATHPAMELTVSQAMEIGERALRDVRTQVLDVAPLGPQITLANVQWARRRLEHLPAVATAGKAVVVVNRLRRLFMNLPTAIVSEAVNLLDVSPLGLAARQVASIGAGVFVRRVGAYAIQAFSGQASLDISTFGTVVQDAPLRMLLLGPLNAGKSSLLNAMFGQERSKSDILPCPAVTEEHVLDRAGELRAVILDSDGFGGAGDEAARGRIFAAIQSIDLIVAVTSAAKADRDQERRTLDEIRRRFAASTTRSCPPIVVAATHIDALSPAREWTPPYDFRRGDSPKEASVRDAVDAIGQDLQIPLDRVAPVCLRTGMEYNVDEEFLPAIGAALATAERAKFLRLVEANRSHEATQRLARRIDLLLDIVGHVTGVGRRPAPAAGDPDRSSRVHEN